MKKLLTFLGLIALHSLAVGVAMCAAEPYRTVGNFVSGLIFGACAYYTAFHTE